MNGPEKTLVIGVHGMDRTNSKNQSDIQRAIGRLEGKLDEALSKLKTT